MSWSFYTPSISMVAWCSILWACHPLSNFLSLSNVGWLNCLCAVNTHTVNISSWFHRTYSLEESFWSWGLCYCLCSDHVFGDDARDKWGSKSKLPAEPWEKFMEKIFCQYSEYLCLKYNFIVAFYAILICEFTNLILKCDNPLIITTIIKTFIYWKVGLCCKSNCLPNKKN